MRFSTIAAVAAATAPIAVSAKGQMGFALGVRKSDASCKTQEDFTADFAVLKQYTSIVRTYSAVDQATQPTCYVPGAILPAAKAAGIKVILGLWADTSSSYKADKDEILKYASLYSDSIYAFTVGSETLYRHEQDSSTGLEVTELLNDINDFKQSCKDAGLTQKVGTADSWNKFQDGTADPLINGGVKLLLINAFGYWQSQDISNASATYLDDLQQAYGHIQSVAGSTTSIELWNGETGWPTDGGSNYHDNSKTGTAVASTQNAQYFYSNGVCAALDWNFNVFYFEAFQEQWKPDSKGLDGQVGDEKHWGAFDSNRNPVLTKFDCSYS